MKKNIMNCASGDVREEEYNVYEKSMGRSRNVQRPEIEDAES